MHQLLFSTILRDVMDEQKPATPPLDGSAPTSDRPGARDRFWFQALAVVVIVVAIGVLVVRFGHGDVVQNWQLIATCPAEEGTAPSTVSTSLDTSDCATNPSHSVSGRGWPISSLSLPRRASSPPSPPSAPTTGPTMRVEYKGDGATAAGAGVVLAFIEVSPSDLPPVPFTIEGASGPVTVTSAPTS